jgi:hypothetical protein
VSWLTRWLPRKHVTHFEERLLATLTVLKTTIDGAVTKLTDAIPKVQQLAAEHASFVAGTAIPPAVQTQIDAAAASATQIATATDQLVAALTSPAG